MGSSQLSPRVNLLEQPLQDEESGHNQGHVPQLQHRHAIDNIFDELNEII